MMKYVEKSNTGTHSVGYTYARVDTLTTKHDGNTFTTKKYTYKVNANGTPTGQVSGMTITDGKNNPYYSYTYTYDQNGNITGIDTTTKVDDQETTHATRYTPIS